MHENSSVYSSVVKTVVSVSNSSNKLGVGDE